MGNRGNAAKRPYMSQFLLPADSQRGEGELSTEWGEKDASFHDQRFTLSLLHWSANVCIVTSPNDEREGRRGFLFIKPLNVLTPIPRFREGRREEER